METAYAMQPHWGPLADAVVSNDAPPVMTRYLHEDEHNTDSAWMMLDEVVNSEATAHLLNEDEWEALAADLQDIVLEWEGSYTTSQEEHEQSLPHSPLWVTAGEWGDAVFLRLSRQHKTAPGKVLAYCQHSTEELLAAIIAARIGCRVRGKEVAEAMIETFINLKREAHHEYA